MGWPIQMLVRYGTVENGFAPGATHKLLRSATNGALCCRRRPRRQLCLWLLHVLDASPDAYFPLSNRSPYYHRWERQFNLERKLLSLYRCECGCIYAGVGKRVLSPLRRLHVHGSVLACATATQSIIAKNQEQQQKAASATSVLANSCF